MVRVRLNQDPPPRRPKHRPAEEHAPEPAHVRTARGLTERQWVVSLLVLSGLLLLITFRGCILPSGVGPKQKVVTKPVPSAAPATAATGGEYTVKSGDTLSKIASDNGTTIDAIRQANGLTSQSTLHPGDKLKIPK